ncbi:D-alanine--D-alanine ligase [Nakamurella sp. YIM 132087]|uniref:D-alanine--D-alanine ligase n=1 Tax=Nakamurella alba TaxID=2665158 RepID=A0A7K1FJT3_9ACTN|nr:D-alanine--D-alanine ligase family protein [Nakamurella alba]MTD13114.1 D-alanine--D-alanine ligase [Nakamurella alba]
MTHGTPQERIRIAVIFGGRSGEHPVSCISANSVLGHLDRAVFDVTAIGITTSGGWVRVDPDRVLTGAGTKELPAVGAGDPVVLAGDPTVRGASAVAVAGDVLDVDVVFPVLHGPYGEDGTIQGLLEMAGLPYVGPGVLASAAGMDKEFTKKLLAAEGLPVGRWVVLRPGVETLTPEQRDHLGLPVFVKPARAGSSLGVSRVDSWADLADAIAVARQADPKVLVEAAVIGREIECGVLEYPDGRIEASPTAEISVRDGHEFYDFSAKYLEDVATFDIPAKLPDEVTETVRRMAVQAFRALDAQGLARVDFFVGDDGAVVINEVNTMPGFTPISMYPRMWEVGGVSYPELLEVLVRTAVARGTGLR